MEHGFARERARRGGVGLRVSGQKHDHHTTRDRGRGWFLGSITLDGQPSPRELLTCDRARAECYFSKQFAGTAAEPSLATIPARSPGRTRPTTTRGTSATARDEWSDLRGATWKATGGKYALARKRFCCRAAARWKPWGSVATPEGTRRRGRRPSLEGIHRAAVQTAHFTSRAMLSECAGCRCE